MELNEARQAEPLCVECGQRRAAEWVEWIGRPGREDATTGKRAWSPEGPRTRRLQVRFSPKEFADLAAIAAQIGAKPGTWVAHIALLYARGLLRPIPAGWRSVFAEMMRLQAHVVRVSQLLHRIDVRAGTTGTLPTETTAALAEVRQVAGQLARLEVEMHRQLPRGRSRR